MKEHDDAAAVRQAFAEAEGVLRGLEVLEVGDGTADEIRWSVGERLARYGAGDIAAGDRSE